MLFGKKKSTFIIKKELSNGKFKMNKIINKFLLTGDKFMTECLFKQLRFTYNNTLASTVYKIFDKKTRSGVCINEQLAKELHKPVIKKF